MCTVILYIICIRYTLHIIYLININIHSFINSYIDYIIAICIQHNSGVYKVVRLFVACCAMIFTEYHLYLFY